MPKHKNQIQKSNLPMSIQQQNQLVGTQNIPKKAKSLTFDEAQFLIKFYQRYNASQHQMKKVEETLHLRSNHFSMPSKSQLLLFIFFCLIHRVCAENILEMNNNILNELFDAIEKHSPMIEAQENSSEDAFLEQFDQLDESLTKLYAQSLTNFPRKTKKGETFLTQAASEQKDFSVRSIIADDKTKIHETNSKGETALIIACKNQQQRLINFLLKSGSDTNHKDNESNSPLTIAAFNKDQYTIQQLIKYGANVNQKTDTGTTPYIIASSRPQAIPYLKLLLQHGANPNILAHNDTLSAVYYATHDSDPETLEFVLAQENSYERIASNESDPKSLEFVPAQENSYEKTTSNSLPIYVTFEDARIDNLLVLLNHAYFPIIETEQGWKELESLYNEKQLKVVEIFKQYHNLYNKMTDNQKISGKNFNNLNSASKQSTVSEKDFNNLNPELKQSTAVQLLKLKYLIDKGVEDKEFMTDLLSKCMNHSYNLLKIAGFHLQKYNIAETRKYLEYALALQRESYTYVSKPALNKELDKARELYKKGDYHLTRIHTKAILREIPDGVPHYLLQAPFLELLTRCEIKLKNFEKAKKHALYAVITSDLDHFFERVKLFAEVHTYTNETSIVEKIYQQAAMAYYITKFYVPANYTQQIPEIKVFIETILKPYNSYKSIQKEDKNLTNLLYPLIDFIVSNDAFSEHERSQVRNVIVDSHISTLRFLITAPTIIILLMIFCRYKFFKKPTENIQAQAEPVDEPVPEVKKRKTKKEKREDTDKPTYSQYKPVLKIDYDLDQEKITQFETKIKEMDVEISSLTSPQNTTGENIEIFKKKLKNLSSLSEQAKEDLKKYKNLNTKQMNFPQDRDHIESQLQKIFQEFEGSMLSYNNWLLTLEKTKPIQAKKFKEFKPKEKKKPSQTTFSENKEKEEKPQPEPFKPSKEEVQEKTEHEHIFQEGYLYKKEDSSPKDQTIEKKKKISKEIKNEPYDEKTKKIINTIHFYRNELETNRKYIDQDVSNLLKFNVVRGLLRSFIHFSHSFLKLPKEFQNECNVDTNDINNLRNITRHPWGIFVYSLDPKGEDVKTLCNESIKIADLLISRIDTVFSGKQESQKYCISFEKNPLMEYIGGLLLHNFAISDLDLCLTRIEIEIEFMEQAMKVFDTMKRSVNPELYEIYRKGLIASLAFLGDSYIELRDKHPDIISQIRPRGTKYSLAITKFINEMKSTVNSKSIHFKLSRALEVSDEEKQNEILGMLTPKEALKLCADISNRLGHQVFGIEIKELTLLKNIISVVINSKKSLLEELRPLVNQPTFPTNKKYQKTFFGARNVKQTMETNEINVPSADKHEEMTDVSDEGKKLK